MGFFKKLKKISQDLLKSKQHSVTLVANDSDINTRINRLERNYIILLKRVLELDGVKMISRTGAFTDKILHTPNDELGTGLNEPKPTIH